MTTEQSRPAGAARSHPDPRPDARVGAAAGAPVAQRVLRRGRGGARCGRQRVLAALSLLLALSAGAPVPSVDAADTYYRWKDERGKLVVSDRPPADPDIEYEVVSQRTSLVRRVRPGEGAVPPEVVPRPGNRFEQVETGEPMMEKNPEACARARTNLETLDTSARIRIRDPDTGEMRYLTEEEKVTQRERAEETIRVHCE